MTRVDWEPLDMGDVPLDELLLWREHWTPANETDPDRAEVGDILDLGIVCAEFALGITKTEKRGPVYLHTVAPYPDCPECRAARDKCALAADYAFWVAESIATFDDWPDPVEQRNKIDELRRLLRTFVHDSLAFWDHVDD